MNQENDFCYEYRYRNPSADYKFSYITGWVGADSPEQVIDYLVSSNKFIDKDTIQVKRSEHYKTYGEFLKEGDRYGWD